MDTSRSTGHIDFNQELSNPVQENIASSWNLALNLGIVSNLTQFEIKVKRDIHNANQTCKTVILRFIHTYSLVTTVTQQAQDAALIRLFREMKLIKNFIRQRHMEISRSLVPNIKDNMMPAYKNTLDVRICGGRFSRMKNAMVGTIATRLSIIFPDAVNK